MQKQKQKKTKKKQKKKTLLSKYIIIAYPLHGIGNSSIVNALIKSWCVLTGATTEIKAEVVWLN